MATIFVSLVKDYVTLQAGYVMQQKVFSVNSVTLSMRLTLKVKVNVMSVSYFYLTTCIICKPVILQNIRHLHYNDLYNNIFQPYDN